MLKHAELFKWERERERERAREREREREKHIIHAEVLVSIVS